MKFLFIAVLTSVVTAEAQVNMFRGGIQLTGNYNEQPVYSIKQINYTFKTVGAIRSSPVVAGKTIYVGSGDGIMYALDILTGVLRWSFKTNGPLQSTPCVSDAVIYFSSRDGHLYAVSTTSGKLRWKFKQGNDLTPLNYWDYYLSSPILQNGNLYIGSGDGYLYSIDAKNGKLIWKSHVNSRIRTTPAIAGNIVVVGSMDGHVYGFNKSTGKLDWKFTTEGAAITFESGNNDRTSVVCSPVVSDRTVVIGGRDSNIYALDPKTGALKWKVKHDGGSWVLSLSMKDGKVFAGSGSAFFIHALEEETGKEIWKYRTKGAVFSSHVLAGDMIYFNDRSGNLIGLNNQTGEQKFSFPMGGQCFSTPALYQNQLFSATDNGVLFALQGGNKADEILPQIKKIVFWEVPKSDSSFRWFRNSADVYLRDFFKAERYEQMNGVQLKQYLEEAIQSRKPGVIIFANNRFPSIIVESRSKTDLIRKYLDIGGKVVLLGDNPLIYITKPASDVLDSMGYEHAERVFEIKYPEFKSMRGFYSASISDAGKKMGMRDFFTSYDLVPVIPDQTMSVIAYNEYGQASAWLKNYGGSKGMGLLQLCMPRTQIPSYLEQIKMVIEFGVDW